ncbi:hypothetical protein LINGRAHAP2_LOCUS21574 [Linum grandiflorum]
MTLISPSGLKLNQQINASSLSLDLRSSVFFPFNASSLIIRVAANFGACTITRAEIQAAIFGLPLAWDFGYRIVNLHVDSQVIISYINRDVPFYSRHSNASFCNIG